MKDSQYELVPLHKRPDLLQQCCDLLNSEWKRSETARLRSLTVSCDEFPTCYLLVSRDQLIGHCKASLVPNTEDSVIIESFIIDQSHRYQGFGSMFLQKLEEHLYKNGIKNIFLTTRGQEDFYSKNGFVVSQSDNDSNSSRNFETADSTIEELSAQSNTKDMFTAGPPPPPMPTDLGKSSFQICLSLPARTFMKKALSL
ncbi:hypothetical protein QAD02_005620 [Eretmocerus hayati]|uniref:Uncharacterized protein n=1 Tax=Eretmocerus hayati TaxID=131215 RepID=A0ACC2NU25_9HYME|nr:hypothetical protein QAD02_005620 [Eretmocerus hayati]